MSTRVLFTRALVYGGVLAIAVAVVGGAIAYAVAGPTGLAGALIGAALAAVFLGLTTASMLVGGRVTRRDPGSPVFFAIVAGAWLLKLVVFVGLLIWLRTQDWFDPVACFVTVMVVVIGSLVADIVAFARTRIPIDVELPGDPESGSAKD